MSVKHMVIPDTQAKPGQSFEHMRWAGKYAVEKQPDVIIHIGDNWDMPSLSTYDVGKKGFEGRKYVDDIEAGNACLDAFDNEIAKYNKKAKKDKKKQYKPRKVFCLGNHEQRIERAIEADRKLEGLISYDNFNLVKNGWEVVGFLEPIIIDGIAYCLDENHKVLTRDLKYKALKDIKVGDKLLAFEEEPTDSRTRKYVESTVLKHGFDTRELLEVKLSCGKSFRCTEDHLWLAKVGTKFSWVRADELTTKHKVVKAQNFFEEDTSYEAGYLAGVFDGEGWLSKPNNKQGGIQLAFAQRDNECLQKCLSILDAMEVKYKLYKHTDVDNPVYNVRILGSSADKLELLGKIRADRLIAKFDPKMLGRLQKQDKDEEHFVESVTPCGEGRIVKIETSSGTFISEGFAHHNCHYFTSGIMGRPVSSARLMLNKKHMSCVMGHVQSRDIAFQRKADGTHLLGLFCGIFYRHDEDYLNAQTNGDWAGIWMLHDVDKGQCDEMPISVRYLEKKYG